MRMTIFQARNTYRMLRTFHLPNVIEAGCDEAGRGCLAGPVFAGAAILPSSIDHPLLNDSKKLTPKQRQEARAFIEENATSWAVGIVQPDEIDQINILKASFVAMHRALDQLQVKPQHVIVDGNRFIPWSNVPFTCMIKGDAKYKSIAAASILAKTHRDEYMKSLSDAFPQFKWNNNKGYPTKAHRAAIAKYGPSPHHRMSFKLLPDEIQGKLF